jgi:hemerythrin-like metal-binding protein
MLHWTENFPVGDERIDRDHRMFLELINEFSQARAGGASPQTLSRIIREMVLFARFHFLREQNLIMHLGLPGVEDHRLHHLDIVNNFNAKLNGLDTGQYTPEALESDFIEWFYLHMTEHDSMIADHLQTR